MSITGDADSAPLRVGYPIADTVGGLTAADAICRRAERRGRAARSRRVDAGGGAGDDGLGGVEPPDRGRRPAAHGNENPTSAPSGAFRGGRRADQHRRQQGRAMGRSARHLGLDDLLDRPDYATREDRKRNRVR
jgi:crotonobetainyl-CoA:carnitine CoA-transferase CaiB-like acyl-CoA transferase